MGGEDCPVDDGAQGEDIKDLVEALPKLTTRLSNSVQTNEKMTHLSTLNGAKLLHALPLKGKVQLNVTQLVIAAKQRKVFRRHYLHAKEVGDALHRVVASLCLEE